MNKLLFKWTRNCLNCGMSKKKHLILTQFHTFLGFSREIANLATRADSENENQEITPDTDTDSQEHLTKHSMMPPPHTSTSFKRTPMMGTRIDARNSKRSSQRKTPLGNSNQPVILQQQQQQLIQQQPVVGALEVQNVKRAINRYGTLPKSSRIGAYLESLRQNGENESPAGSVQPINAQQMSGNVLGIPETIIPPSTHSPRTPLKVQPQMIRSNSSGGVTMTNSATASLTKLQRHRTTTDGTMMTTFSSFRSTGSANSPKRNIPALADLEFPPPPPPEEFETNNNQFHPDIPSSMKQQKMNNDVSNTAPSVEEASTRFGVSLRKREPSTDSCSSLGSPGNDLTELSSKTSPFKYVPTKPALDPAAMLVNELADIHIPKPEAPLKPSELIRKQNNTTPKPTIAASESNGIPFKAQLKKVEREQPKNDISTSIIDFKSRLRRVDGTAENDGSELNGKIINNKSCDNKMISEEVTTTAMTTCNINNNKIKPNSNNKKTEIKIDVQQQQVVVSGGSDEEDKRKSTGSISSLKKIWEAKEQVVVVGEQLSPKSNKKDEDSHNNNGNGHHENMDPPVAKKPAVPVKPSKFSIYATPIQNLQQQGSVKVDNNSAAGILELVHSVECNLKVPVSSITAAQWHQLSEKLNIIQSSCVSYADNETMPPHTKFQFRELVTRVENQSNCLRTAGQKNVQDNEKLLIEVGQSLKQLSNALHR